MPKIAYVCEACWANAKEESCWEDRGELRVLPTGEQICQSCYENGDWFEPVTDDFLPSWSSLPQPPEYAPAQSAT